MARILRGDIIWADLNPVQDREQAGRRPVVVVSEDIFNARSGTVIAMAIISSLRVNADCPRRTAVKWVASVIGCTFIDPVSGKQSSCW